MKKIFNTLLVVAMLLVQIIPTTLVRADDTKPAITINKAIVDESYSIYKILTLESYDADNNTYIYRVAAEWEKFITDGEGKNYLQLNGNLNETTATQDLYVTWKAADTDTVKQAFTKAALEYAKTNSIAPTATKKADATTIVFDKKTDGTDLDLGYYVIDSTLGSLCILTTTKPTATVEEKNTIPSIKKEVQENRTKLWGTENDANIGETVEFKSTITVGTGTEKYVFYDKMDKGLTLTESSIEVYVNETKVDETNNYTTTIGTATDSYTFKIEFTDTYIASLEKDATIVITYEAVLNKDAIIEGVGNLNEAWLTYGNKQTTEHQKTYTYSYAFDLIKKNADATLELTGAKFRLYTDKTGGTEIPVVEYTEECATGVKCYRRAVNGETGVEIEAGKVYIKGLDAEKYYLEETAAPTGYNKLSERVEVEITTATGENTYERTSITVRNSNGTLLPSTGGIGTVLFLTIGSLLVLGFGVLLVTKLRMSKIVA